MLKSASAWPGARETLLTRPIRRSELMKVPIFSPQPAAGDPKDPRDLRTILCVRKIVAAKQYFACAGTSPESCLQENSATGERLLLVEQIVNQCATLARREIFRQMNKRRLDSGVVGNDAR
jgi:hypothetical protein